MTKDKLKYATGVTANYGIFFKVTRKNGSEGKGKYFCKNYNNTATILNTVGNIRTFYSSYPLSNKVLKCIKK